MTQENITLTITVPEDLNTLFKFQQDTDAVQLAAFTPKDPNDKAAYIAKYTPFLSDPTIHMRTIKVDNEIAGSIAKFVMHGDNEITYWIDKKHWGKGIATAALKQFLAMETARPIFGRAAFDNFGSQKVLEKAGFVKVGIDKGFANARGMEVEEVIYELA